MMDKNYKINTIYSIILDKLKKIKHRKTDCSTVNYMYRNSLSPVNLIKTDFANPICFPYFHGHPIVLEMNLCDLQRYVFSENMDPYINACKAYIKYRNMQSILKVLSSFYSNFQPSSVSDLFDLGGSEKPDVPVSAVPLPWEYVSVAWHAEQSKKIVSAERRAKISDSFQTNLYGPLDFKFIEIEARRIATITESMIKSGYIRNDGSDGDIEVYMLYKSQSNFRFIVRSGSHRFAAAKAIGIEKLPVRLFQIIYYDHAEQWPCVVQKIYTVEQARKIFHRFF